MKNEQNNAARDLFGPGQTGAIRDLLQSLFSAELLKPSTQLWLVFGWISDVEILDNRARQFSSLNPDWPVSGIHLTEIIQSLLERGGEIALVLRDVEHNKMFLAKLAKIREKYPLALRVALGADVHEKGILGDDFLLSGSMNLTYNGITVNDEHLTLRTDRASIEEWRVVIDQKWGRYLQ